MLPFYESGKGKEWRYQVIIAINQVFNAIFNGAADETICSRSWRNRHRQPYKTLVKFYDWLFFPYQGPNHCENAHLKELNGRQRPEGMDTAKDAL
jgi:hypothetical protein